MMRPSTGAPTCLTLTDLSRATRMGMSGLTVNGITVEVLEGFCAGDCAAWREAVRRITPRQGIIFPVCMTGSSTAARILLRIFLTHNRR
jgi:hypothetical protein